MADRGRHGHRRGAGRPGVGGDDRSGWRAAPGAGAFALIWLCAATLSVRRLWPEASLVGSMLVLWYYLAMGYQEGPVYLLPAVAVFSYVLARPSSTA
ncbi:hypothetical protein GCM10029992_57700 [Glycomyces albus]